jgi:hypothetical protein
MRVLIPLIVLFPLGCSKKEAFAPVSGSVSVNDGAVPSGTITLYPDAEKGNTSQQQPTGLIKAGQYEIFATAGIKGAPPGWYKVVVYAVDDPKPGKPNNYFTNKMYADIKTTPLSLEVIEKPESGRYDLKLKP